MKSQKGFAAMMMLTLLPLIITVLCAVLFLRAWILPQAESLQVCRAGLLDTLQRSGRNVDQLLDLNSEVIRLRKARTVAELAIEAAWLSANPLAVTAAEAALKAVISLQKILVVRQQFYLTQARISLLKGYLHTHKELHQVLSRYSIQYHQSFDIQDVQQNLNLEIPSDIAVRQAPEVVQGPPLYELLNPISEKQRVQLSWKYRLSTHTTRFKTWFPMQIEKKENCAATWTYQKQKLQATLTEGKSWWRSVL